MMQAQVECADGEAEIIIELLSDSYLYEVSMVLAYEDAEFSEDTLYSIDFYNDTLYNMSFLWLVDSNWYVYDIVYLDIITSEFRANYLYADTICVPQDSCFTFTINDSYGDGICCDYPWYGNYAIYYNGELIRSGGDFVHSESTNLGCGPGSDCVSAIPIEVGTYIAEDLDTWYVFAPDSSGLYEIGTCGENNNCNTKLWVYDKCAGLIWDENVTGSIAFVLGGCPENDELAYHTLGLSNEETYYIRIGDADDNCVGEQVEWSLNYLGPITGCTDPLACNFNPAATVDNGCLYPGNPDCPAGPDLTVDQDIIKETLYIIQEEASIFSDPDCLIDEQCLTGFGLRQLMKFDLYVENIGDVDYFIGKIPDVESIGIENLEEPWEWAACHGHLHYAGFAEYLLYDLDGNSLPVGFKAGVCVEDSGCSVATAKFTCGYQGITAGCWDWYPAEDGGNDAQWDCQWIDITDIDEGVYTLVVRTNWQRAPDGNGRVETDYDNNWAQVCLNLYKNDEGNFEFEIVEECDPFIDCAGDIYGNALPDCAGDCNGIAKVGDINGDSTLNNNDFEMYIDAILNNGINDSGDGTNDSIFLTQCNDINSDSIFSVIDLALMNACILQMDSLYESEDDLCDFSYIISDYTDTVTVTINGVEPDSGYADISMLIPDKGLLAFELDLGGIAIDSFTTFYDNLTLLHNHTIDNANGTNIKLIGYVNDMVNIPKATIFEPIFRVHFTLEEGQQDSLCLNQIVAAINGNRVAISTQKEIDCVELEVPTEIDMLNESLLEKALVRVVNNPNLGETMFYFDKNENKELELNIFDPNGKLIHSQNITDQKEFLFEHSDFSMGVYFYTILTKNMRQSGKIVVF